MANVFEEYERELLAKANTLEAKAEFNALIERNAKRLQAERQRHIDLGWCDEDGNSLLPDDEDDDDA